MNTIHSQICSQRILPCPYCGIEYFYKDMKDHLYYCDEYTVKCDNQGCTAVFPRKQLLRHQSQECLLSMVSCEWNEFGCNHKTIRKDMKNHHTDSTAQHLQYVKNVLDKILAMLPQDQVKRALDDLKSESGSQQGSSSSLSPLSNETFIKNNKNITDEQLLRQLSPHYNTLKKLDLDGCAKLTDSSITKIAQNCTQLQWLNLKGCSLITDGSIVTLSQNCQQLDTLFLWNSPQVTDRSITKLSTNCTQLQVLGLESCSQITDNLITQIATNCKHLSELYLSGCTQITDTSVILLSQKCQLKKLGLSYCTQISENAITQLSQNCRQLQHLYLGGCNQVTDATVISLVRNCPELLEVYLSNCQSVTQEVKDELQSLRIITQ
eukprot:TRINITY_DN4575_c0_g1_i1.p1 TRINITY_DN4575_c0_g1~~TRINITY_DN4575_c0_g1_i1.p1  ORF type:complete len:437 (-),score=34.10 TRINITY_DN4575_c0_g1_i1:41-1177(-)